ncbi:hypothetical protein G6O69_18775 [Pseudenhygromyxa sp. WMMC2535]|uniref:hypothetical protein n=1 Tax=Pseudenhygromyxa sp. WMMC2535 TaxID=2712867 RepID=UPI001554BC83|nr:hypothetical protein [Pseudenhygromyxa sp. WMMC2535]NVB39895.1 hypothetical protein [Pseudenhygromyxa sp. WMMC2535]
MLSRPRSLGSSPFVAAALVCLTAQGCFVADREGDEGESETETETETQAEAEAEVGSESETEVGESSESESSETSESTGSEDPSCATQGGACQPTPPDGWEGPFELREGPLNPCVGDYGQLQLEGGSSVSAEPAECACECGVEGAECGPVNFVWFINCTQPVVGEAVEDFDTCHVPPNNPQLGLAQFNGADFSAASCAPQAAVELPTPTYVDERRLCGGQAVAGSCDEGEQCMPSSERPLCVFASGDLDCPADWPQKSGLAVGVDDQRGCSECSCDGPTDPACVSTINTYDDEACSGAAVDTRETGTGCGSLSGAAMIIDTPTVSGCEPNPVTAQGDVAPMDTVTLCCQG